MKFLGAVDDSSNTNNNGNNWLLGFPLSQNFNMEQQQQQQVNTSPDLQFHHFQHQHRHHNQVFAEQACGYHMPLKTDGSLCINTPHPYTQQEMSQGSSPKLEDFLGVATMGGDYTNRSLYFGHNAEPLASTKSNISQSSLAFVQRQQQNMYHLYQHQASEPNHLLQSVTLAQLSDDGVKNWVSSGQQWSTTSHHDFEQQMSGKNLVVTHSDQLQALTLSMSPGSLLSCVTAQISPSESASLESKKRGFNDVADQKKPVHRKSLDTFGQRTSQFRGVTRHRWTGRYEAHLWDNSCKKEGQTRKGRQVYLGGYDMEEKAARAYDLAGLKYWGPSTHINFSVENYQEQIEEMKKMSRQEYVAHLRRKSSGFSRGASIYRGVTRHHQHGRWQARIGRVAGNKDLYLGTFSTQEEAAEAYDVAAIKFRGVNAVTNFDISRYDVERIIASNTLLVGEQAKRNNTRVSSSMQTELVQNLSAETNLNYDPVKKDISPASVFLKPQQVSPLNVNSNTGWIPSKVTHATHIVPHLPVLAAWHD